jgi:serine/threonine-protein kinase
VDVVESDPDRKRPDPSFKRSSSGSGTRERPRIGRYEVVGEIASGGMATVYLALLGGARGPQRFVALKVLHPHLAREPEFVAMFLDEARLASSIRDPHVVPIAEIGRTDDGFFLVMDYVEGDTLARFAARAATRGTRLPRDVVVRIMLDALTGLHAAHELTDELGRSLGLVHRDVSPQNILVGTDGLARITDFGVARAAARLSSTRNGRLKGKLAYMAPEQARSEATDRRADVFAAGILVWEMLAGRRLFKAETEAATILRVVVDPIPRLASIAPDVPAPFDAVCTKALSRNPDDRYQTARHMADALAAAAAEAAASSPLDLGVASPRDVAAYVQEVIGQEIAMQRDVVRAWLEQSEPGEPENAKGRFSTTARLPLHRPLGESANAGASGDGVTATTTVGDEVKPAVEAALRESADASVRAAADEAAPTSPGAEVTPPPETPPRAPEGHAPARPKLLLQPAAGRAPHPPPVRSLLVPPKARPVPAATPTRRGMGPIRPLPATPTAPKRPTHAGAGAVPGPHRDAAPTIVDLVPPHGELESSPTSEAVPSDAALTLRRPAADTIVDAVPQPAVTATPASGPAPSDAAPRAMPSPRPAQPSLAFTPADVGRSSLRSPRLVVGLVALLLALAGAVVASMRGGPDEQASPVTTATEATTSIAATSAPVVPSATATVVATAAPPPATATVVPAVAVPAAAVPATPSPHEARGASAPRSPSSPRASSAPAASKPAAAPTAVEAPSPPPAPAPPPSPPPAPNEGGDDLSNPYRH